MRTIANLAILSAALWVACASQGTDSGARMAALEARLERLEGQLTQDAAVVAVEDASVEAAVERSAMADAMHGRRSPVDGGPRDPAEQAAEVALCKTQVETRCSEDLSRKRLEQMRAKLKRKPGWLQPGAPVAPDSTPEGRACLKREREQCDKRFQRDRVLVWLDSQVEPGKRDEEFTKQIRTRIAEKLGVEPDAVDAVCALEFCRFGPGISQNWKVMTSLGEGFGGTGVHDASYSYRARSGFELAQ